MLIDQLIFEFIRNIEYDTLLYIFKKYFLLINIFQVYWANGAQIIPPHDKAIQQSILSNLAPLETSWNVDVLANCTLLADPYEQMFKAYHEALSGNLPTKFVECNAANSELRFVYTAMHGVGYPYVEEAFRIAKLQPVVAVPEQKEADPEFPTVTFPNPEEGKSALKLSIEKAEAEGISVILANDPDADRLACAEKNPETGIWKVSDFQLICFHIVYRLLFALMC